MTHGGEIGTYESQNFVNRPFFFLLLFLSPPPPRALGVGGQMQCLEPGAPVLYVHVHVCMYVTMYVMYINTFEEREGYYARAFERMRPRREERRNK